jgi:hypothetical protein
MTKNQVTECEKKAASLQARNSRSSATLLAGESTKEIISQYIITDQPPVDYAEKLLRGSIGAESIKLRLDLQQGG